MTSRPTATGSPQQNPDWSAEDVLAKAEALIQVDVDAARAVLLDNGDWDGGLADLSDPAADGIPTWLIRGDPAAGGYHARRRPAGVRSADRRRPRPHPGRGAACATADPSGRDDRGPPDAASAA